MATHIRIGPRVPDPEPDVRRRGGVGGSFLAERAARACAAGIGADRIVLDAGLDLGKTAAQSLELLRASGVARRLGLSPAPLGLEQDVPRA